MAHRWIRARYFKFEPAQDRRVNLERDLIPIGPDFNLEFSH